MSSSTQERAHGALDPQEDPPAPPGPAVPHGTGPLGRLAAMSFRRRGRVLAAWVLALCLAAGAAALWSGEFEADYSAPGSESRAAQELLEATFPAQSGEVVDVVVRPTSGTVEDPATAGAMADLFAELRRAPHVTAVELPSADAGSVSEDGRTAAGKLRLDVDAPEDMPTQDTEKLLEIAESAADSGLTVALGGEVVGAAESIPVSSEIIGIAAAAVILVIALRSLVAAGLPILVALVGVGVSLALIPVLADLIPVPDWTTSLAAMMGIGIGIDYVLLMLTRFREWRSDGLDVRSATVATLDTAGRSVLIAGATVVISMLGLFGMGVTYMRGAALGTILTVLVVMLAAVTLLPALLGYAGRRAGGSAPQKPVRARTAGSFWMRWGGFVERHSLVTAVLSVGLLVVLALPLTNVRFGFPDAGNDASGTPTRTAHDLMTEGFGAGANGPLVLAASIPEDSGAGPLESLRSQMSATPGVAGVGPVVRNDSGDTAVVTVTPRTGPQTAATEELVDRLRDEVIPAATAGTGVTVLVGGVTATSIDSTGHVVDRLPLLIGGVVLLSMLLLLVAFRSVVIPVKAALMNLLSVAAAYGVVAYVLQGGWAGELVGIDDPTPLPAFIPVLMFAILFGLSMDYEVFLLTRMRESWAGGAPVRVAVVDGLAATSRVITAAAAIMIVVFGAFVPSPEIFLTIIGVGLASAILIDATIVRLLLVPAVMFLLGERAWWLPTALARRLPQLHVEGRPEVHRTVDHTTRPAVPV